MEFKCEMCGEPCEVEHEQISYSGTHCTHGRDGVWTSDYYVSCCCGASYVDYVEGEDE